MPIFQASRLLPSYRRYSGRCMDSSNHKETFTSSIHENQRRYSISPFPPHKASFLRCCAYIYHCILFHPTIFGQTQQYVRIYNLAEQKLVKTLMPGIRWISSMDVHPSGDHLIVGGYDRKLCWFDLELSEKPYKVLRYV